MSDLITREHLTIEHGTSHWGGPLIRITIAEELIETTLAAEWRVKNGKVEYVDSPTRPIAQPADPDYLALMHEHGERGTALDRLREAFVVTATAREARS